MNYKKITIKVTEIFWIRNEYCFNMIFLFSAFYRIDSTHSSNIQWIFSFWHCEIEIKQQSEMEVTNGNLCRLRKLFFSEDEIRTNGICNKWAVNKHEISDILSTQSILQNYTATHKKQSGTFFETHVFLGILSRWIRIWGQTSIFRDWFLTQYKKKRTFEHVMQKGVFLRDSSCWFQK